MKSTGCHFCGLPIPAPWFGPAGADGGPRYCCYGCRIAQSLTQARGEEGLRRAMLTRIGLAVFFSMNVMVFSLALWAQDGPSPAGDPLQSSLYALFRWLCMLFALPVLYLLGGPLWNEAVREARQGRPGVDLLLVIGVAASFAFSAYHVAIDQGHVYFEVGCAILVLVTFGRWLEGVHRARATQAVDRLERLLPERARRIEDGKAALVAAASIPVGASVLVLPGETIPFDGQIERGKAALDLRLLTGESEPEVRQAGDEVPAGGAPIDGELLLRVRAPYQQGTLQRLVRMVREAGEAKGRYQRLADRIAAAFLPAILATAVASFGWHAAGGSIEHGISAALCVLVVACPCALGLATPTALWAAMGRAAMHHVVFPSAESLERLARVRALRFDKTGTLTTGRARVVRVWRPAHAACDEEFAVGLAGALAARSNHPAAAAIADFARAKSSTARLSFLGSVRSIPGRGMLAACEGVGTVRLGSLDFLKAHGIGADEASLVAGEHSIAALAIDERLAAVFVLAEELRPEAGSTLAALAEDGLDVRVLTGDREPRGRRLARELGVPVDSGLLPEDKLEAIRRARSQYGAVAMVGDGVNDAPALADADVGIALGCGTDLSRAAADVCLLSDDLGRIPWTIALARRTVRTIQWNLAWAFTYNLVGVGWAATGRLSPVIAAAAMVVSSALVVGNSMRLAGESAASPWEAPPIHPSSSTPDPAPSEVEAA